VGFSVSELLLVYSTVFGGLFVLCVVAGVVLGKNITVFTIFYSVLAIPSLSFLSKNFFSKKKKKNQLYILPNGII
jgi:hypothetical protein